MTTVEKKIHLPSLERRLQKASRRLRLKKALLARAVHSLPKTEETMSKKTKLEIMTEEEMLAAQRTEQPPQKPAFVATYPGEREIEMDDATRERLEAEKAAQLAGMHLPPHTPPKPAWRRPAEEVVEPGYVEDVIAAPPIEPVAPGAVAEAKATVIRLQDEYRFASETREIEHKNKLAAALKELGDLEVREAQSIDQQTSANLRDVLASIRESKVGDDVREAKLSVGSARQEDLRRRAAPVREQAAQTRRLLKAFDKEYGDQLDELRAISRSSWLEGTPAESPGAHVAAGLYGNLENGLQNIQRSRDALAEMLRTDVPIQREGELSGGFEPELLVLIEQAAKGWDQNQERAWVWALTRLQLATPDSVGTLQTMVKGVIGAAARLRDMKSPLNTERARGISMLPEPVKFPTVDVGPGWSGLEGGR